MKRKLTRFLLIFSSVVLLVTLYIGLRLALTPLQWLVPVSCAFFLWLLPAVHWSSEADQFSAREILLQQLSFICVGLMSWLLVLTLARDLILVTDWLFAGRESTSRLANELSGMRTIWTALLLTALGSWWATRGPRLREIKVRIPGLPDSLNGLRIAQITDLHIGPMIGERYVRKAAARVRDAKADLTVLTGDIVDGNLLDVRKAMAPLSELTPRGQVYYVPGNHEYYWGIENWVHAFEELGAQVLMDRGASALIRGKKIWIGGMSDLAGGKPDLARATAGSEAAELKILLSHRPDPAPEAAAAGYQLQLSGHTHGGQFFPWTLVVHFVHRHSLGLYRVDGMSIYVSPGTGSWGPPLRIGTTPEVSCIVLEKGTA